MKSTVPLALDDSKPISGELQEQIKVNEGAKECGADEFVRNQELQSPPLSNQINSPPTTNSSHSIRLQLDKECRLAASIQLSEEFEGKTLEALSTLGVESFCAEALDQHLANTIDRQWMRDSAYSKNQLLAKLEKNRKHLVHELHLIEQDNILPSVESQEILTQIALQKYVKQQALYLEKKRELEIVMQEIERSRSELDIQFQMNQQAPEENILHLQQKKERKYPEKLCVFNHQDHNDNRVGHGESKPSSNGSIFDGLVRPSLFGITSPLLSDNPDNDPVLQLGKRRKHAQTLTSSASSLISSPSCTQQVIDINEEESWRDDNLLASLRVTENEHIDLDDYFDIDYANRLRAFFKSHYTSHPSMNSPLVDSSSSHLDIGKNNTGQIITKVASSYPPREQRITLAKGLYIESNVYKRLFQHQRVALKWLWELHQQNAGGILGDEMGLGKTIEIIAFLQALGTSSLITDPILVVCPATVIKHWIREFHTWAPLFRVLTFQKPSGSILRPMTMSKIRRQSPSNPIRGTDKQLVEHYIQQVFNEPSIFPKIQCQVWREHNSQCQEMAMASSSTKKNDGDCPNHDTGRMIIAHGVGQINDSIGTNHADIVHGDKSLVDDTLISQTDYSSFLSTFQRTPIILVISYDALRLNIRSFLSLSWQYCIMDEGQKLRNPEAQTTQLCKQIVSSHRLILTGTPIQNNLTELWSLFDFCMPSQLGTLDMFESQFSTPILQGGYSSASPLQVRTAYKCAQALRDLVNPYILRRGKNDVQLSLPQKKEHILFCKLTEIQKIKYKLFLKSRQASLIFQGKMNAFYGIDILRKICNHLYLLDKDHGVSKLGKNNADFVEELTSGSCKMSILVNILDAWKKENLRVLLFTQTIQMLNIIEELVQCLGYSYFRMDGNTACARRQALIDKFNHQDSQEVFLFLLTTRTGGLGISLTSASRVIIYDPDWNPMTDHQARERVYRIGQQQDVIIYRLVTRGTIEEKIYHRQVFKHYLMHKILSNNPNQGSSKFNHNTLAELFRLDETNDDSLDPSGNEPLDLENSGSASAQFDSNNPKDSLLEGLLRVGMSSTVDHEQMICFSSQNSLTTKVLDIEAEKLAKEAVERLRQSRLFTICPTVLPPSSIATKSKKPKFGTVSSNLAQSSKIPISPTLNKNGQSSESHGHNESYPLASLSSQMLLKHIKDHSPNSQARMAHTLFKLQNFLKSKPNQRALSDTIIQHFKDQIEEEDRLVFRQLLRQIAVFHHPTKTWTLKKWAGGPNLPNSTIPL